MPPVPWGTISGLSLSVGPSSSSVVGSSVWLEIVTVAGPAPMSLAGLTLTPVSAMSALSSIGAGGRGLFSKSSDRRRTPSAAKRSQQHDQPPRAPIVGATLAHRPRSY